jgi:hypothetical protein
VHARVAPQNVGACERHDQDRREAVGELQPAFARTSRYWRSLVNHLNRARAVRYERGGAWGEVRKKVRKRCG